MQRRARTTRFALISLLIVTASLNVAVLSSSASSSRAKRTDVSAVRSWLKYHEAVFTSLETDIRVLAAGIQNGSIVKITSDCGQLGADVATASHVAPIPDASVQRQWSAALQDFGVAATDCTRGVTEANTRLTDQFRPKIEAGITLANEVVGALKKLS